uniref:PDEase domain-containing protein n=1 Tax=Alexandrium andersonii TaxID=327968 RepID=A0A7S2HBG8_9DINO
MSVWKDGEDEGDVESMLTAQKAMLENAGLSLELLNSWNLNPLELDKTRTHAAAMYFVGPHNHGISFDPILMVNFLEAAELGYMKTCPYHNWFHAIDVTHGVFRLLHICSTEAYLTDNERYGLLVSAVCHDIGHPGLNNAYLIETSHDLALRYNDKSPLENMHCAKLFEIVAQPKCNIFSTLSKPQYQDVRKVCIDAILNTDNAQHFSMIKEVQMIYEVNSEILDASRELYTDDPDDFPPREAMEVFREPESRKLLTKVFLHVADISNSMKPFRICRLWAWQVLEEFFLQGDAEKRLGVPVQALNDREKVNRPFSQVGFIEFLVSPLVFAVIRVLPPMEGLADQMIQNVRTWHSNWRNETKPPPSDTEQTALAERVSKLEAKYLEVH